MDQSEVSNIVATNWPLLASIGAVVLLFFKHLKALSQGLKSVIDQLFEWMNQSIERKRNKLHLENQEFELYQEKFKSIKSETLQLTEELNTYKSYVRYLETAQSPVSFQTWIHEKLEDFTD